MKIHILHGTKTQGPKIIYYYLFNIFSFHKCGYERKFRIFGLTILKKQPRMRYSIWYFCKIPVFFTNREKTYCENLVKSIKEDFDDIYIVRYNIGETTVFLSYISEWIKVNKSKKPLVICWNKKHVDFYKMFIGDKCQLKQIDMPLWTSMTPLPDKNTKVLGHNIFCSPRFIAEEIKKFNARNNQQGTFYDYILNLINVSETEHYDVPQFSKETESNVDEIIKKLNLGKKFVVLLPEATTLKLLPMRFWECMCAEFVRNGYDVFVNSVNGTTNLDGAVSSKLTVAELACLSKKAESVIGLASGMLVLLTTVAKKVDAIYTDFKDDTLGYTDERVKELYSLYSLPWNNHNRIKEYVFSHEHDELRMLKKILTRYFPNANPKYPNVPKVSVIMPVYNAEQYLERSITSLLNQTCRDIEIICIDDQSSDNSLEILKEFKKQDKRIKVVQREKNGGAAAARNSGLKVAMGEYIGFVDSDDYVDEDFFEKLYDKANQTNADIVVGNTHTTHDNRISNNLLDEICAVSKFKFSYNWWSAIYNKRIIEKNKILFSEQYPVGEDIVFLKTFLIFVNKYACVYDTFYHYDNRPDSLSYALGYDSESKIKSYINSYKEIFAIYNNNIDKLSEFDYCVAFTDLFNASLYWLYNRTTRCDLKREICALIMFLYDNCRFKKIVLKDIITYKKDLYPFLASQDLDGLFDKLQGNK